MSQRHFPQRPVAEERLKADDKLIVITRTLYLKTTDIFDPPPTHTSRVLFLVGVYATRWFSYNIQTQTH